MHEPIDGSFEDVLSPGAELVRGDRLTNCGGLLGAMAHAVGSPEDPRDDDSAVLFQSQQPHRGDCLDKRVEEIRNAIPATTDQAVITGYSTAVMAWTSFLKQLLQVISDYDQRIEALAKAHPDSLLSKTGVDRLERA